MTATIELSTIRTVTHAGAAATTERSLLLAHIYRRDGRWRLRAIGQGYDHGLGELATLHGVTVDDA